MKRVERIGIVGTGVIGASWTAQYLARGFDVIATDPGPKAEEHLRHYVNTAWKALERIGLSEGASQQRLLFTPDLKEAVSGADLVQENGPERMEFKIKLFADIDAAAPPHAVLASSSSGLTMSTIQSGCQRPDRCVIGHPFNPPHLIPLVEVVGGAKTSPETVQRTIAFYESIGKKPIHVRKEVVGHVANRLQAALSREIFHLIEQGVVDVADADAAVCWGPGLRWGAMGPTLIAHLAGGEGGIRHFLDHLGPAMESWWKDLGRMEQITPALKEKLIAGVSQIVGGRSVEALDQQRDDVLLGLLALRAAMPAAGGKR